MEDILFRVTIGLILAVLAVIYRIIMGIMASKIIERKRYFDQKKKWFWYGFILGQLAIYSALFKKDAPMIRTAEEIEEDRRLFRS